MRMNEELRRWCEDELRQTDGMRTATQLAVDWHAGAYVARIRSDLARIDPSDKSAMVEAAKSWVSDVRPVADLVAALARGALNDPFFRPVMVPFFSDVSSGLMLFDAPGVGVAVAATTADALAIKKTAPRAGASINFPGRTTIYRFIRSGNAMLSFWTAPQIDRQFSASDATCVLTGRRRIEDGEVLTIDGSRESFVVEHIDSSMIYLNAVIADDSAPVSAEYDSRTKRLIGVSSNDDTAARIEMMASLVRLLGRRDAVPVLAELIATASFSTRWQIMREMLALDALAALPMLRGMASDDPHPEVRAAAAQTLKLFFSDAGEAA